TFVVNLSTPANATLGAKSTGTATILDDDGPDITINDVTGPDGASGTTPFTFTVSLSVPATRVVTVAYTTMDGSNAQSPNDYLAASGTLTFQVGQRTQTISVSV